jgi:hypothetical protein
MLLTIPLKQLLNPNSGAEQRRLGIGEENRRTLTKNKFGSIFALLLTFRDYKPYSKVCVDSLAFTAFRLLGFDLHES